MPKNVSVQELKGKAKELRLNIVKTAAPTSSPRSISNI